ncbi:MAG: inositol 2-dehydrogenase [Clostridiales bacterium]|jgi:myo-inositol 2-dehydrogenase/D-chiro-inositol 1-dehydrogenase|nr:inositol 2-dehydrogenase [Clostridiales bacterium]
MVKVGIIGVGRIGKVHCQSITRYVKNAKVKAIADPYINDDTIKWAQDLGIFEIYTDYNKILDDSDIDAVLICSSTDTHSQICLEAIKKGKHIFCEKPIDHDVAKILEVKSALRNSNVKFQVGFNRRFDSNFKAVRQAVKEGKIGQLNILKICSRDPGAPPIDYIKVSGGIFLDMTIHDFDMVRFISGDEVDEVFAYGGVLTDKKIGEAGDIDTAIISMKLKGGSLAVIDNSRRATYGYDQRAEAFGSLGQVAISNNMQSTAIISDADGVHQEKPLLFFLERYMQAYVEEITEFVDCIVNDKEVSVGVDCGLQPVLIGLAAKKSLSQNRPVKIAEIESEFGI